MNRDMEANFGINLQVCSEFSLEFSTNNALSEIKRVGGYKIHCGNLQKLRSPEWLGHKKGVVFWKYMYEFNW